MDIKAYVGKIDNITAENKLLKFVICVIGIASVISAFISVQAVRHTKTIILPPVTDRVIEITGNDANDDYFKMYAKYVTNLLANYTPATFEDQKRDLLSICSPEFYKSMDEKLGEIKDGVTKFLITSIFHPTKVSIDRKDNSLEVTGRRSHVAKGLEIENKEKIYIIKYKFENGRFYITDLSEGVPK